MKVKNKPWCPWCFVSLKAGPDNTDEAKASVSRHRPLSGLRGQTAEPWDYGGWGCSNCMIVLPTIPWVEAMIWAANFSGYNRNYFEDDIRAALRKPK